MVEIEGSKSAVNSCELPTGVVHNGETLKDVVFREMSGYEEDILANRKMSVSKKLSQVIANCITKIGNVEDRELINGMSDKLLITDRLFMLVQLRIASVGEILEFVSTCPECEKTDKKMFDLNNISINGAPKANNLFKEIVLPKSKKKLRIKAADAKIEEKIEKATNEKNAISLALFARIDSVDDAVPVMVDIMSLSTGDRSALRKAIDELEGKIDDEFETTCPHCAATYKGNVPITGVDFFFP